MNAVQRDKCYGRRLIASGGDFGITYAQPARIRSPFRTVLAMFPFVAFVVLCIVAATIRIH